MNLFIHFYPRHRCRLNDLLNQVFHTHDLIRAAATPCILDLLENKIDQIGSYYRRVNEVDHWVNYLGNALLVKRCELLTLHYPENEEA